MSSDPKSAKNILAEHLCPRFGEVARAVKTEFGAEKKLLTERICEKLADHALEMAEDPFPAWDDLRDEIEKLTPDDFTVLYELRDNERTEQTLRSIEVAINTMEVVFISYGQKEFSFDGELKDLIADKRYDTFLLSFNPEHCTDLRRRYAACCVIADLEFELPQQARKPAGSYGSNTGLIQVAHFPAFAYLMNSVLDEHALPENNMYQYVKFEEALVDEGADSNNPQTPKP